MYFIFLQILRLKKMENNSFRFQFVNFAKKIFWAFSNISLFSVLHPTYRFYSAHKSLVFWLISGYTTRLLGLEGRWIRRVICKFLEFFGIKKTNFRWFENLEAKWRLKNLRKNLNSEKKTFFFIFSIFRFFRNYWNFHWGFFQNEKKIN